MKKTDLVTIAKTYDTSEESGWTKAGRLGRDHESMRALNAFIEALPNDGTELSAVHLQFLNEMIKKPPDNAPVEAVFQKIRARLADEKAIIKLPDLSGAQQRIGSFLKYAHKAWQENYYHDRAHSFVEAVEEHMVKRRRLPLTKNLKWTATQLVAGTYFLASGVGAVKSTVKFFAGRLALAAGEFIAPSIATNSSLKQKVAWGIGLGISAVADLFGGSGVFTASYVTGSACVLGVSHYFPRIMALPRFKKHAESYPKSTIFLHKFSEDIAYFLGSSVGNYALNSIKTAAIPARLSTHATTMTSLASEPPKPHRDTPAPKPPVYEAPKYEAPRYEPPAPPKAYSVPKPSPTEFKAPTRPYSSAIDPLCLVPAGSFTQSCTVKESKAIAEKFEGNLLALCVYKTTCIRADHITPVERTFALPMAMTSCLNRLENCDGVLFIRESNVDECRTEELARAKAAKSQHELQQSCENLQQLSGSYKESCEVTMQTPPAFSKTTKAYGLAENAYCLFKFACQRMDGATNTIYELLPKFVRRCTGFFENCNGERVPRTFGTDSQCKNNTALATTLANAQEKARTAQQQQLLLRK